MVVATGTSQRHIASMAEKLVERLKAAGHGNVHAEGLQDAASTWILIDAGDVLVHLFRAETRAFYDIEKLWSVAPPRRAAAAGAELSRLGAPGRRRRPQPRRADRRPVRRVRPPLPLADPAGRGAAARTSVPPERRMAAEAELLLAAVPPGAAVVALDERGRDLASADLARQLGAWRDEGRRTAAFLIGGPDGLAERALRRRRPAPRLRPPDLAAPAGPRDAGRAALPRHDDPGRPPLPSAVTPPCAVCHSDSAADCA